MASIDKIAIGFTVAIVAIGIGFAFYMDGVQTAGPAVSAPVVSKPMESQNSAASQAAADAAAEKAAADAAAKAAAAEKAAAAAAEKAAADAAAAQAAANAAAAKAAADAAAKAAAAQAAADAAAAAAAGPTTHIVDVPAGTASPGCEESNSCYLPASLSVSVGDTVEWDNIDTAAHTVTAGSPAEGPSGAFDSSLLMAGASYSFTFDAAGSYDYFCMVHPWMTGKVTVN
ncbi:MAG: cupredoxin domain-containing protein [Nitrosopumilus sp.]